MYTTVNETGQLNNYATEPEMYYAYYPSNWEQQQYVKQGAVAAALVSALVVAAFVVTSIV